LTLFLDAGDGRVASERIRAYRVRRVERTEHAERRRRGSVVSVVSVVTHALQHGFSTTWKRDDDDVDTVRDGKREPVSMVRDYYDYYDDDDDDYYDAEAATANEG
jgi:hypothetical protein